MKFNDNDKKKSILYATIKLLNSGIQSHKLKISDIALEAGVGKGTVYEYFSSKENLIKDAVILSINEEIEDACAEIGRAEGFEGKFYAYMSIMDRENKNVLTVAKSLIAPLGSVNNVEDLFANMPMLFNYGFEKISALAQVFIGEGVKDGVMSEDVDIDYFLMAIVGAISAYMFYLKNPNLYLSDLDEIKKKTYNMLVKSLKS